MAPQEAPKGVRYGEDRAIGSPPNWDTLSSEALYKAATENNNPDGAARMGATWNQHGKALAQVSGQLTELLTGLENAWTGPAADSARGAMRPLADWGGMAGATAQLMGVRMSESASAAQRVKLMPPPTTFDRDANMRAMLAGGPAAMTADLAAQQAAADRVKREQVAFLDAYTKSMAQIDSATPTFAPPPKTVAGEGRSGPGGPGVPGEPLPAPHPAQGMRPNMPGAIGAMPIPGAGPDGEFGTGDDGDPVGSMPGGLGGLGGLGGGSGGTPTGTAGYTPSQLSGTTAGPAPAASMPAAPSAGAGGFGGGFGFAGGGAPGRGAAGSTPAAAPGDGAAESRSTRGGSSGRARPDAMGAGGVPPGARSDDEDDLEHESPSYLVEADPGSAFGSDESTVPPVIGGDR
ncbi:hypothetical protein EV193_103542 [Herbihabitans rhizosphaerae]|uniref:PPE family protein n=1 Tax=Herbihabitans rhizosphaerae TaxID=1872711 RepID=A0A4Q7KZS0_9PSEU|nr:hypothetical protein [Herbihabitans rhizosphaerae]RZS41222.1 hypothetical protein EV193_103542 [Herbihabitans rhizosphaerae]